MRDYGGALEADFARFYPRDDLLDFYRGTMSARRLWVLVRGLPPESQTYTLAHEGEQQTGGEAQPQQGLAKVRYLEDIPVAKSLREAGGFLQANNDEFSRMSEQAG